MNPLVPLIFLLTFIVLPVSGEPLRPLLVLLDTAPPSVAQAAQRLADSEKGEVIRVPAQKVEYLPRQIVKPTTLQAALGGSRAQPRLIVLIGSPFELPTFQILVNGETIQTDFFHGDLDGDSIPEVPVIRVLGSEKAQLAVLQGARPVGRKATIMCSEPTPIHLETKNFLEWLGDKGYAVRFNRGQRQDYDKEKEQTQSADVLVHFGHGDPNGLMNRTGQPFMLARQMPDMAHHPIAIIGGCTTAPVGSPFLSAFFESGGCFYIGSSAVVYGMRPAEHTNRLFYHFYEEEQKAPGECLAILFHRARLRYLETRPGLKESLKKALEGGQVRDADLFTVTQWGVFGNPLTRIEAKRGVKPPFQKEKIKPGSISQAGREITIRLEKDPVLVVLNLSTKQAKETLGGEIVVEQDGREIHRIKTGSAIIYQRLDDVCYGGFNDGVSFHGRFLLPIHYRPGKQVIKVRWMGAGDLHLEPGSNVEIWQNLSEYALIHGKGEASGLSRYISQPPVPLN